MHTDLTWQRTIDRQSPPTPRGPPMAALRAPERHRSDPAPRRRPGRPVADVQPTCRPRGSRALAAALRQRMPHSHSPQAGLAENPTASEAKPNAIHPGVLTVFCETTAVESPENEDRIVHEHPGWA